MVTGRVPRKTQSLHRARTVARAPSVSSTNLTKQTCAPWPESNTFAGHHFDPTLSEQFKNDPRRPDCRQFETITLQT